MENGGERGKIVLYSVENVTKLFGHGLWLARSSEPVHALDDVTFQIHHGETFGLVGESGSGKTTLGRLLVRFEAPTQGLVKLKGRSLSELRGAELKRFRKEVQMVYQNPFSSLNPRRTVESTLAEGPAIRALPRGAARHEAIADLLQRVGLHSSMLRRYPHEFSGGQRQRIVIARALSASPSVLVADEPVSALDASVQAQVLDLLRSLRQELGLTIVMITHDLRVVNFFCDRVGVLYRGRLVELGNRRTVIRRPFHPYTQMLISAAPTGNPATRVDRSFVRGELSAAIPEQDACVFSSRCWLRSHLGDPERCTAERPMLRPVEDGHLAACHFAGEVHLYASQLLNTAPQGFRRPLGLGEEQPRPSNGPKAPASPRALG